MRSKPDPEALRLQRAETVWGWDAAMKDWQEKQLAVYQPGGQQPNYSTWVGLQNMIAALTLAVGYRFHAQGFGLPEPEGFSWDDLVAGYDSLGTDLAGIWARRAVFRVLRPTYDCWWAEVLAQTAHDNETYDGGLTFNHAGAVAQEQTIWGTASRFLERVLADLDLLLPPYLSPLYSPS